MKELASLGICRIPQRTWCSVNSAAPFASLMVTNCATAVPPQTWLLPDVNSLFFFVDSLFYCPSTMWISDLVCMFWVILIGDSWKRRNQEAGNRGQEQIGQLGETHASAVQPKANRGKNKHQDTGVQRCWMEGEWLSGLCCALAKIIQQNWGYIALQIGEEFWEISMYVNLFINRFIFPQICKLFGTNPNHSF